MKKRILLSMFSISLLVGTLPMNLVASGVEESIISTEYQEDGDIYYETVLEEVSSNARSSTKSGSKTVKCKNKKEKSCGRSKYMEALLIMERRQNAPAPQFPPPVRLLIGRLCLLRHGRTAPMRWQKQRQRSMFPGK